MKVVLLSNRDRRRHKKQVEIMSNTRDTWTALCPNASAVSTCVTERDPREKGSGNTIDPTGTCCALVVKQGREVVEEDDEKEETGSDVEAIRTGTCCAPEEHRKEAAEDRVTKECVQIESDAVSTRGDGFPLTSLHAEGPGASGDATHEWELVEHPIGQEKNGGVEKGIAKVATHSEGATTNTWMPSTVSSVLGGWFFCSA